MEVHPVDPPQEVLRAVKGLLNKDGGIQSMEVVDKVFSLMKACHKAECRYAYLRILLRTGSHDILNKFICVGGYSLLNLWLTSPSTTQNIPMIRLILLSLKKLPLTVHHLKQNNTGRLVKHLTKRGKTEELRKLASELVDQWKNMFLCSVSHTSEDERKRKKEDKVCPELKTGKGAKSEHKEQKGKKPITHAPSHAKLPYTGLGLETKIPESQKKPDSDSQPGDKSKTEPTVFDSLSSQSSGAPPEEKKNKPQIRKHSTDKQTGGTKPCHLKIKKKKNLEVVSPTSDKTSESGHPAEPLQEVLWAVKGLLNKDGGIRSVEVVDDVFSLMKACHKAECRCAYLRILLRTKSYDILNKFICVGEYSLLNLWLTSPTTSQNVPMLKMILLSLKKLPLTIHHLKQNNTGRLVRCLSKRGKTEELKKLASDLMDQWKNMILFWCFSHTSEDERKRQREDKVCPEVKTGDGAKSEHKEQKGKKPITHAPSHAKLPYTDEGLGLKTNIPVPPKKQESDFQPGDKSNIEPAMFDSLSSKSSDTPPEGKKHKPQIGDLSSDKQTVPLKRPLGYTDPYSAPQIGTKKQKEPETASPTLDKTSVVHPVEKKDKLPNKNLKSFYKQFDFTKRSREPASFCDLPKIKFKIKSQAAPTTSDRTSESENVMKTKTSEQAMVMDSQACNSSQRHDTMEKKMTWRCPRSLAQPASLVSPGVNSTEKVTQKEQEMPNISLSHKRTASSLSESCDYKLPKAARLDCRTVDENNVKPVNNTAHICVKESPAHSVDAGSSDDCLKQPDLYDKILRFLHQNQGHNPLFTSPPVSAGLTGHRSDMQAGRMNNMSVQMPMSGGVYPPNQLTCHAQYNHPQPPHCRGPPSNTCVGPGTIAATAVEMPMNVGYTTNKTPQHPQYDHLPHPHSQRCQFNGPQQCGAASGNYHGKDCPGPRNFPHRPGPYWGGGRSQCRPNRA